MSRFYGSLQGMRGTVTRQGGPGSGEHAHVSGWDIGGKVYVYDHNGEDYISFGITGGSHNGSILLDLGTYKLVDGKPVKVS
jgi:hypothetical protein